MHYLSLVWVSREADTETIKQIIYNTLEMVIGKCGRGVNNTGKRGQLVKVLIKQGSAAGDWSLIPLGLGVIPPKR